MSERKIHAGYWYVPLPASTRGGQHVGTPRGVLVYDETLQLGVLSFSERSQFKSVADANALLDLAIELKPGARRAADLTSDDVEALRSLRDDVLGLMAVAREGAPGLPRWERQVALLDRLADAVKGGEGA